MNYNTYLELKDAILKDESTVNYLKEKLNIPIIVARCLVKDWHEQQEQIERIEEDCVYWKMKYRDSVDLDDNE